MNKYTYDELLEVVKFSKVQLERQQKVINEQDNVISELRKRVHELENDIEGMIGNQFLNINP
jgi:hypothetical protein